MLDGIMNQIHLFIWMGFIYSQLNEKLLADKDEMNLVFSCLMPQFLVVMWNVPFYLGGTSLLIVVVVVMDFMSQVQSHLMSQQYDSLMKKANLKNYGRSGSPR